MKHSLLTGAPVLFLCALSPVAALSHAVFDKPEVAARSTWRATLKIGHGCDGAATTKIVVAIPEGVIGVKPMPKAGWTVTTVKGAYAREYPTRHGVAKDGVKELTWSGGPLPDDFYDEFVFSAYVTDAFAPGASVHFPVVQQCEKGELRWVETPAAGQDARKLKAPAPAIRILPAHEAANSAVKPAGLEIVQPWMRATPQGAAVAGGFAKIVNNGKEADRLIGASMTLAGRTEVHEMAMSDGVMKMRALPDGLEIPAGGAVELKPGGFHIMFLDLKGRVAEGAPQRGTLVFEKAGAVPVTFEVAPIGAPAPAAAATHQH